MRWRVAKRYLREWPRVGRARAILDRVAPHQYVRDERRGSLATRHWPAWVRPTRANYLWIRTMAGACTCPVCRHHDVKRRELTGHTAPAKVET